MATKKHFRPQRIAEVIQVTLSTLLVHQIRDPRLQGACILAVDVTSDLSYATVRYGLPDNAPQAVADADKALKKATGFFRSQLAKELSLRTTPELRFRFDDSANHATRIEQLIKEGMAQKPADSDD